MKRFVIIALFLSVVFAVSSQSLKERKKYRIKSVTEWHTEYTNGKAVTFKSDREEFDKDGNSILKCEYGPDEAVLHKVTVKFDKSGNKTEETEFDAEKKRNVRTVFKYNAFNDKTEEAEYNASGLLVKKTTWTYNKNGDKDTETITDANGKMLKKTTYGYNSKSLRSSKQTINRVSLPESAKKWEYEFY